MTTTPAAGAVFVGAIPELYDTLMVPLLFAPYADDLARRVAAFSPARVLETAAGSGAVTRALARALPEGCEIVATDLSPPMLARAQAVGTARAVTWQPADAQALPFPDASFDIVACQFGAMFFPDKPRAFSEARRVLRPGGHFVFSVWDRIETNEFTAAVADALAALHPAAPPRFMQLTPHGYFERAAVEADLAAAGFGAPGWDTLDARSHAASARVPAMALCQGTPLRGDIEALPGMTLASATEACAAALAARFGDGPVSARLCAHVVTASK